MPRRSAAVAADPAQLPAVLAALHRARVLAPVVALLGEQETTEAGLVRDKSSDIAVPLLLDDEGRRALPVFTDLAALARWDPVARPVPVAGPRAAQVALAEGADAVVIDVAGPIAGHPAARPRSARSPRAGAASPAWDDPQVSAAIAAVLAGEPAGPVGAASRPAPDGTPGSPSSADPAADRVGAGRPGGSRGGRAARRTRAGSAGSR